LPAPDLDALLGRARDLTRRYMAGGPPAMPAFEELTGFLLGLTVLARHGGVRLAYLERQRSRAAIGGLGGPTDPLPLNDGRYLRTSVSLYLDDDDERGPLLKVAKSSYQYQADHGGKHWVFRYDYLREPGPDPNPQTHLQVNGTLAAPGVLAADHPLGRVHFPTDRVSLEGVIRLLADQFNVPCNTESATWRPVLAESERAFQQIAHRPLSGPEV
jgi:hypothetical protein